MQLRVVHTVALTSDVRLIGLADIDGASLPAFEPGAHLSLGFEVGPTAMQRQYSLVSDPAGGACYEIAVKRNPDGRGGSTYLHDVLAVGDVLESSAPIQAFGIAPDARHHVLIAGGIGITPMLGMISRLRQAGVSHELHYAAKTRESMAFRDRLADAGDARVALYFTQDEAAGRIDIERIMRLHATQADTPVYVCGPSTLIDHVRTTAAACGVTAKRVHFESFGPAWSSNDGPVTLVLAESDITIEVPVGTTLLDAMEAAGAWIASDCRRGECGACVATYTGGTPIHRDSCLTEAQRAHAFCPCVSWAASSEHLTLQV